MERTGESIIKWNANTFSLNAIVDVRRRRRHDMIFLYISESTRASDFKFCRNVAADSLYISTGNDVMSYFQSAVNRTNVYILGHVLVTISR